jgi:uncharacterized protein YbaR (Trm112 family)
MIPQDLLDILRCPHCVSGDTRAAGDDPGRLEFYKESWLICQEPGCGRKYPVVDEIPEMLIETGDKWISTPPDQLPVPPHA